MIIILGSQMQTSFILVISFVFCLHGLLMNLRGNFRGQSNYWIILLIAYLRVVAAKKKSSIRNETMETKNVWYQTATVASTKIICVNRPPKVSLQTFAFNFQVNFSVLETMGNVSVCPMWLGFNVTPVLTNTIGIQVARDVCNVCAIVLVLLVETVMTQATAYVGPILVAVSVTDVLMVISDFQSVAGKDTNS